MRSYVSIFLVIAAGFTLLWWGTDGFQAFTAESARRLAIMERPKPVPATTLEDQNGMKLSFDRYRGKLLLLTFIYTRCDDLCPALEQSFQEVYEGLPEENLGEDVFMLTVSFDTSNDSVYALHHYAQMFNADGEKWRMTRVPDAMELQRLLDQFGVLVIPDGNGGYEHNAAIYLVDREGLLLRIFDFENPQPVIEYTKQLLEIRA